MFGMAVQGMSNVASPTLHPSFCLKASSEVSEVCAKSRISLRLPFVVRMRIICLADGKILKILKATFYACQTWLSGKNIGTST